MRIKLFEDYFKGIDEQQKVQSLIDTVYDYYKDGVLTKPVIKDKVLNWLFDQIIEICKELREYKINSSDFLNTNNWGVKKDGSLAVFDIGFGDAFEEFEDDKKPSTLDIPEIEEEGLLKKILLKYNIKSSTLLGSGLFGHAHDIGNNKVLKITRDKSEAINSKKVEGKTLKHIANIYSVDYFVRNEKEYYVIILEKLKISDKLVKDYESLKNYFDDIRSTHLDKSFIDKIKTKHKIIGEFLEDMITIGYSPTWEKWKSVLNDNKELTTKWDFNDISEIAEWVKGSVTNNHRIDDNIPDYVLSLVEELSK